MSSTALAPRSSELTAGQLPRFTALAMLVVAAAVMLLILLHSYLILGGEETRPAAMAMSSGWLLFWCVWFAAVTLAPAGLYRAAQSGGAAEAFA